MTGSTKEVKSAVVDMKMSAIETLASSIDLKNAHQCAAIITPVPNVLNNPLLSSLTVRPMISIKIIKVTHPISIL
jgi:hypothetical protein